LTNKYVFKGNDSLLVLYEKGKGINEQNFAKLIRIVDNLTAEKLKNDLDVKASAIKLNTLLSENACFDIYSLNIFEMCLKEKIKPKELIETLKKNLKQCESLEEGDIVAFQRGLYSHHAIITGKYKHLRSSTST
jgi:hypothetical protein